MNKQKYEEDAIINSIVKKLFSEGIVDNIDNYVTYYKDDNIISIILPGFSYSMDLELYQKVRDRILLRKRISPEDRKSCMCNLHLILNVISYDKMMKSISEDVNNKTIIKFPGSNKQLRLSCPKDVIIDIIHEYLHQRDSLQYHCTGIRTTLFD